MRFLFERLATDVQVETSQGSIGLRALREPLGALVFESRTSLAYKGRVGWQSVAASVGLRALDAVMQNVAGLL